MRDAITDEEYWTFPEALKLVISIEVGIVLLLYSLRYFGVV
jgi:hypothetical protein